MDPIREVIRTNHFNFFFIGCNIKSGSGRNKILIEPDRKALTLKKRQLDGTWEITNPVIHLQAEQPGVMSWFNLFSYGKKVFH